jgi:hypothetical protein
MSEGKKTTTEEVLPNGIIRVPLEEMAAVDISDKNIENMARGFILGNQAIGRRKEIKALLEDKVIGRIGKKGKKLTDKLFELVEGIYVVSSMNGEKMKYYKTPPNLNAIIYCLDRVLGKPVTKAESADGDKKGIKIVSEIIENLAGERTTKKSIEINQ